MQIKCENGLPYVLVLLYDSSIFVFYFVRIIHFWCASLTPQ